MDRTRVSSSNLASAGYDVGSQTLEIEFLNGKIYRYFKVPRSIFLRLMAAISHTKYFDDNVKRAGFHFRRIR